MRLFYVLFLVLDLQGRWVESSQNVACSTKGDASSDVLLQNGSTFTITCNLTEGEGGLTLSILKGNNTVLSTNNSTQLVWKKDNVQGEDRAIYYCVAQGVHCGPTPFSAASLAVAYAPLKPTEHWCIGHDLEIFTCYWSVPRTWIDTTYRVLLHVGSQEVHSKVICKETLVMDATNVTCELKTAGELVYRIEEKTLHFKVEANNSFGSQQWDYEVDHFANVQLNAPTGIKCQTSKDSIRVTWDDDLPDVSSFPPALYQVEVAHHPELTRQVTGNLYLTIEDGPIPYTRYEVTIREKFGQSHMWSTESEAVSCVTSKDRPKAVPNIAANGFSIDNYEEKRDVQLYFQGIPREEWYGEQIRYVLVLWDGKDNQTVATSNETSYELRDLGHNKEYTVRIYSENEVGRSTGYASLTIPPTDRLLPLAEEAYINASRLRSVQLHALGAAGIETTYTLFWRCGREENLALKSLSWKGISSLETEVDVGSEPSSCVYAVATQKEKQISPMTWIDCVIPASTEYEQLLTGTDRVFATQVTDSSIHLVFPSKCSGLVSTRQVQYRAANDNPDSYKLLTLGDKKDVTISELSSRTEYVVTVNSFLKDGRVIPHEQLRFKTSSKALLYVAIGLCVGFLVVVIIGCVLAVWCRRLSMQFIKLKAATVEVLVPAEFSQKPLRRSESVRSNYIPERSIQQLARDSTSSCQSSDVPLLASDDSLHTLTYTDEELTTPPPCDTSQYLVTYSKVAIQEYDSGYTKVSDMVLTVDDATDSAEDTVGVIATSAEQHPSMVLPSYSRLGATANSPRQNGSTQPVHSTVGYASWFTPTPYSQLSTMLVNRPPLLPQEVPAVTNTYSSYPVRQPYSEISTTPVDVKQKVPDMTTSASQSEDVTSHTRMPTASPYQSARPTSQAPVADETETPYGDLEQDEDHAPAYFKLSAMLAGGSQNSVPQKSVAQMRATKPPPYFKLSAIITNQPPSEPVQQSGDATVVSCSTDKCHSRSCHMLDDCTCLLSQSSQDNPVTARAAS